MKKNLLAVTLVWILTGFAANTFAQDNELAIPKHSTPKWVSDNGYWVVESNVHTPKHNVVYLYNNNNVMVYKETMDGVALNLTKRRIKMHLKKLVDQRVAAYVQKQKMTESNSQVLTVIK